MESAGTVRAQEVEKEVTLMAEAACKETGGPEACPYIAHGNTAEEIEEDLQRHVSATHPDVDEKMKQWSDQEKMEWKNMVEGKIH